MRCLSFFGLLILLCFQLHALEARAESGYQVIQGTRVFTEIDHARGVATFSNSCGSQTLTQRQLQQGAIPSRIIPCNKSSGSSSRSKCDPGDKLTSDGKHCMSIDATDCGDGSSCERGGICIKGGCLDFKSSRVCTDLKHYCEPGYECGSGNKCVSLESEKAKEAKEYLETGKRYYGEKKYWEASEALEKAREGFESVDQIENAHTAIQINLRVLCRLILERGGKGATSLRKLADDKDCRWTPEEISDLKRRAEEIERKENEKERPNSLASTPSVKSKPSDQSSGVKDATHCIDVFNIKGSTYKVSNSCTFGVNIKLETMNSYPKTTETDSYYLGIGSSVMAISYHGFQPVVVSACGKGSVCR